MAPISKENKSRYPKDWDEISKLIRLRAGNQCEICDAENHKPHPVTKRDVCLTVHHLDFNPENNEYYNLIALCQRCHNRIDKRFRARNRKLNVKQLKLKVVGQFESNKERISSISHNLSVTPASIAGVTLND